MQRISGNKTKVVIGTILLVIYTSALSLAIPANSPVQRSKTVSNIGSITAIGVGIYWNQQATDKVSSIDWGSMEPDSNKSVTVYIKNEGDYAVSLSLYTSNWNPSSASDYISVNWDYQGQFITAGEIVQVKLTLSISASIEGIETFSFDTAITAST